MWKLGNLDINGRVVLAPMAGYTSYGYRHFMKQFGVALEVTEMVSDMGLIYGNDETSSYVNFPKQYPTGVQLFGHDPENICKAARIALEKNPNIDFFDINMGCPVLKVTKVGSGSALMKNPKLCGDIVRALKSTIHLPVTAKIRLGWDNNNLNYMEVIKELENAGVDAIAIHARTKADLYSGTPRFDLLKNLQSQMKVPLIISGNIYTLEDAINAIDITGATAVMVARGGVGNPNLIKQIDEYYKSGITLPSASLKENIDYCLELADEMIKEKGEKVGIRIYRSIAPKFFVGISNAKQVKSELSTKLVDRNSLVEILEKVKQDNGL